jgi:glycosyltransferase involved in cell wall biosynthesis
LSATSRGTSLRVALLTLCFWPEVRRGAERLVRELADGLSARGHRPRLITSHPGAPARRVEDGLPIVRHWRPPAGLLERRQYESHLTHVPFSYLSLRLGDDDIAHALHVTDAMAAVRWSRRTGRPTVYSHMGIPNQRDLASSRMRRGLMEKAVRGSAAVTALSRHAADAYRRNLGVEARVIYPPVDTRAFRPLNGRQEDPTIVCAAHVAEPRKRVSLLLEAFRLVRRERPTARLILSRPRDPMEQAAFAIGNEPGVELADLDDRTALARTYSSAWVSVLPSVGEAFGLVLAEALACGTPGVGTNEGGIREVIDRDDVGRLFDGDEPGSLARALLEGLELAQAPETKAACRARSQQFSVERCVDGHERLYNELLS